MLQKSYPYYLGNRPEAPNQDLEVTDKYSGEVATRVALADAAAIDRAIGLAVEAERPMREMPAYERQAVLDRYNWNADAPIEASGYIHVVDVQDIDNPVEVARYEVPEAGAHNVWVENDRLYVGYYQGGLRVVDVSGELRGDLYRQGREMATLKTTDADTTTPNWPMTWGAQIFKGNIFTSDLNSGLWIAKLIENALAQ